MRNSLLVLFGFLLLVSCKSEPEETEVTAAEYEVLDVQNLPVKNKAVGRAADAVNSWSELKSFDQSIERIYDVTEREDYLLIVEELLEIFEVMRQSRAPKELQLPQINSRFNVVKTYLLKVQADLEYRVDPGTSTVELLEAYNAAIEQCNILVNTTLDPKTLFDE